MKNVTQLLPPDGRLTMTTRPGSQVPRDQATASMVNSIFRRMRTICTAWKQAVEGDINGYVADYKRELLDALVREGVSDWEQIERGIASIASDFLPNPNKFARECKGGGEITGAWGTAVHRIYEPERLLEDISARERAHAAGKKTLARLRGIFG